MPASSSDRNLLFGILALQVNFVTRDALIRGMNAWVLEKHRPLGAILVEQGMLRQDLHDALEVMVGKHLELHDNDAQKSLAAVSSVGSVREELEQLADPDVQASLVSLASTPAPAPTPPLPHGQSGASFASPTTAAPAPAPQGVRYRRLRPHARGGLGEVFVALDEELKREVALKEIQDHHADRRDSRARFLLEAKVTGKLEHPGVVPVYGLGTYPDGRPFYAMRFIKGDSLKDAIERFHRDEAALSPGQRMVELRGLLGRFLDVCDAVAYAHSRGVLHRDLKPGNVMLGRYGETLVVDWGLAKVLGRTEEVFAGENTLLTAASSGDTTPTELGQAVGTPQYMSPEQAAGRLDLVGPASDVYSLGAMLYCLLTGRAPFPGPGEDGVGPLLRLVEQGDFAPPRQVKPDVPRALEAVCLKAMAHRREERYASVEALGRDVQQWLAGEPVSAWPEPLTVKAGRWVRKNRVLAASAAAAGLVALVLGTAGGMYRQQQRQRAHELADEGLAQAAALRDDYRFKDAEAMLEQVGGWVYQAADSQLQGQLTRARADLELALELDAVRQKGATLVDGKWDPGRVRREQYPEVLARHGLDVLKGDLDRLTQTIRLSAVHEGIVAALDDWASVAKDLQVGLRLLDLANRSDEPDPWRQGVRQGVGHRDGKQLLRLIRQTKQAKPTPSVVLLLAHTVRGRTEEITALLRLIQRERPRDFWVHFALGNLLSAAKRHQEAVECFLVAVVLRPDSAAAHTNLGIALKGKGKVEEAIACYHRAIALDPKFAKAHNCLGAALKEKGKVEEAIACYHKGIALDPKDAKVHNNLGVALEGEGKVEEAIACFRQAIALDPKDAKVHFNLGAVLCDQKRAYDAAIASFRRAIALDPKLAAAHTNLGAALVAKGKVEEGIGCYHKAIAIDPKYAPAHNKLGKALADKGQLEEAIACFGQAIVQNPNFALAHFNLGIALYIKGKSEEAIACFRKAIALDPKYAPAHNNLGFALKDKGKVDEALSCLKKAIALDPKYATAHNNLGNALRVKGQVDEAITYLKQAIALDPKFAAAHTNLGLALDAKGKVEEAIACFHKAIAFDPKDAKAHHNLGFALLGKGKVEEAIACYHKAIALDPKDAKAHTNLGIALKTKGKVDEAMTCYHKAIAIDPKYAPAHNNLGNALKAKGKVEEAIECYRQALALDPKDPVANHNLGVVLNDKGKVEEAIACFHKAIEIDPKLALAHHNLGVALKAKGKVDEAIACFRKAIDLDSKDALAHGALGQALLHTGRFTEARDATVRALQLLPPGHPLRTGVSRQLAECRRLASLEKKLAPVLRGDAFPAGAEECLAVASLCQRKQMHATAARFAAAAFLARAKLAEDLQQQHRYNAAGSAARAAAGQALDARFLPDKVAMMLRRQALRWLKADLTLWKRQLEQGEVGPSRLARVLGHWQKDADLASLRDPEPLARLDADERRQWRNFWREVEALCARTRPASEPGRSSQDRGTAHGRRPACFRVLPLPPRAARRRETMLAPEQARRDNTRGDGHRFVHKAPPASNRGRLGSGLEVGMNDFDQASRFQVKSYPQAHLDWLCPRAAQVMRWARWLDSQSAPRPGEPDRRCDTIAELVHREGRTHPRALVIELFTHADVEALDRSGEYLWRFRRDLRHGPHGQDKYPFVAALLFLTGHCAEREVQADLPDEEDLANTLKPRILELAGQDAVAFLDAVDQNRLSPLLLAWTPLMKSGQTAETARRWDDLSSRLLGETQRRLAASLALIFSDLTDSRPVWKPLLEKMTMNESTYLREIRTATRMEVQRENLVEVLRTRLSGDVLGRATARVEQQEDLAVLARWFKQALTLSPEALIAELEK